MHKLPKPRRRSLSDALNYFGTCVGLSSLRDDVRHSFHRALCEGDLEAKGDYETPSDYKSAEYVEIATVPRGVWKRFNSFDLTNLLYETNGIIEDPAKGEDSPRFYNVTIATKDIDDWLSRSNQSDPLTHKGNTHLEHSSIPKTYVTYVQAVSWGLFKDWNKLGISLNTITKSPWPVDHTDQKVCLLKGLNFIYENKTFNDSDFTLETEFKRQTATGNAIYQISYPFVLGFIEKSQKPLDQLIAELEAEIKSDADLEFNLDKTQYSLLEAFRTGTLLYGCPNGKHGHEVIPLETFISDTLYFSLLENSLSEQGELGFYFDNGKKWIALKMRTTDIIGLFSEIIDPISSAATATITFEDEVKEAAFKLFRVELKDQKTNRDGARSWCAGKNYTITWGDDFINALPAENKNERKRPAKNRAAVNA